MALLILVAALWAVVLAPTMLKRRSERKSVGSIEHFHHQLHLLERTGPKLVPPAYRLESVESATGVAVGATGYPAITSSARRPNLVLLKPVAPGEHPDDEVVDDASGGHYRRVGPPPGLWPEEPAEGTGAGSPVTGAPAPGPYDLPGAGTSRHGRRVGVPRGRLDEARRRRRDFVALLAGTTVFTALLGIVPSLHLLWVVSVLGIVALAAYVGLAAYMLRADTAMASRPRRAHCAPATHLAEVSARRSASAGHPGGWDDPGGDAGDAETTDEPMRSVAAR